jgi:hypothetical protein
MRVDRRINEQKQSEKGRGEKKEVWREESTREREEGRTSNYPLLQ